MKRWMGMAVAGAVMLAGCVDSTKPLEDPQKAKPDKQLLGLWRHVGQDGQVSFYHIGQAGDDWPEGVFRVVGVSHREGRLEPPGEMLLFATRLGEKSYMNVVEIKPEVVANIKKEGWTAVEGYYIWRYQIDADRLTVWPMDNDAKQQAIQAGKLRGEISSGRIRWAKFTDTPENLVRFLSQAGDSLFSKDPVHLERVPLSGR